MESQFTFKLFDPKYKDSNLRQNSVQLHNTDDSDSVNVRSGQFTISNFASRKHEPYTIPCPFRKTDYDLKKSKLVNLNWISFILQQSVHLQNQTLQQNKELIWENC